MSKTNLIINSNAELSLGLPWNWQGDVSIVSGGVLSNKCFKIGAGASLFQTNSNDLEGNELMVSFDLHSSQLDNNLNFQARAEIFYKETEYKSLIVPLSLSTPYEGNVEDVECLFYRTTGTITIDNIEHVDYVQLTFKNYSTVPCYVDNLELWNIIMEAEEEDDNDMLAPSIVAGTMTKELGVPKTDYIKSACIIPQGITLASPSGNYNSYEGGYISLALLATEKEEDLNIVGEICEKFALLQNPDGSWYQQYNPYPNAEGLHERVPYIDEGVIDGDLKVDSGAALILWAMSMYDKRTGGQRYKKYVSKALGFLEYLQSKHYAKYHSKMFSNLIYKGEIDTIAFAADTAECILSIKHALDTYGTDLLTPNGTRAQTIGNDAYISLCTQNYAGDGIRYFATTYPIGKDTLIPFGGAEKLSYAQSLGAWAVMDWVGGGYASEDYTGIANKVLEFINPLTMGQWGGQLFKPYYGEKGETQNEYVTNTALMIIGLIKTDKDRYIHMIKNSIHAMQWLTIDDDGRTYDFVEPSGRLKVALRTSSKNGYGFLSLGSAHAVMAWELAKKEGII